MSTDLGMTVRPAHGHACTVHLMSTDRYLTRLSVPLCDFPRTLVLREVRAVLQADGRVERVERQPAFMAQGSPVDHVHLRVYLSADSDLVAQRSAADLHGIALSRILDALPDGSQVGWTSAYSEPEPIGRRADAVPGR